jgi:hypothetical protein
MNKSASMIVADRSIFEDHDPIAAASPSSLEELHQQARDLQSELDEVQPVISAAFLAATAFRLRDNESLVSAMRILVSATKRLEEQRACG